MQNRTFANGSGALLVLGLENAEGNLLEKAKLAAKEADLLQVIRGRLANDLSADGPNFKEQMGSALPTLGLLGAGKGTLLKREREKKAVEYAYCSLG